MATTPGAALLTCTLLGLLTCTLLGLQMDAYV